jgi:hypothetical protein
LVEEEADLKQAELGSFEKKEKRWGGGGGKERRGGRRGFTLGAGKALQGGIEALHERM